MVANVHPRLPPPHRPTRTLKVLSLLAVLFFAPPTDAATRYTLPHLVATYRDGDHHLTIEMSYAIPRVGMAAAGGARDVVHIEQTIAVVDTLGKNHHSSWARPTSLPPAGTSGIRQNYVIAHDQIRLPANEYDLHVGVRDLKVRATGSFHSVCLPPGADGRFDMSDLLLATDIQPTEERPITRASLAIQPNPLRLYRKGEHVFVFLELYRLDRDAFGQTHFEIAYRMERPTEEEMEAELFEAMDLNPEAGDDTGTSYLVPTKHRSGVQVEKTWDGDEGQTTIATRYVGDGHSDLTYLQFDVSQLPDGIHKLAIQATDLHLGRSVEKYVLFRVLTE